MSHLLLDINDPVSRRVHAIEVLARNLIRDAETLGVVVNIENVPGDPPAMGNYTMRATVYPRQPQHILDR